jgi:hypothetical protein
VVTEVKSFDLYGVTYYDLALIFSDGRTQSARLGLEGVPQKAQGRDRVLVTMAGQHGGLSPPALAGKRPALPWLVRRQFECSVTGSGAGGDQRLEGGLQPPLATLRARLPGASCLRCSPHPPMNNSH